MGGDMRKKLQCLGLGWKIKDSYMFDGFSATCIEGKQRIGKSSLASQALAEAKGEYQYIDQGVNGVSVKSLTQDYEAVKPWVVFRPKEFLDVVLHVTKKEMCLIWDDAGFWLFALDWYEPFVKTVSRYIQLCGRQFGFLILTTPKRGLISQKVIEALPDLLVTIIHKDGEDSAKHRPRIAKIYEAWNYPDGKKGGVRKVCTDHYDAMLPDEYWKWYKPMSDKYMDVGLSIMKREVTRMTRKLDKYEAEEQADAVAVVTGGEEKLKELQEIIQNLEQSKKEAD